jgi:hypothetical protein
MLTALLAQAQQANLTDLDPSLIGGIGGTTGALGVVSAVAAWVRSGMAEVKEAAKQLKAEQDRTNARLDARLDLLAERIAALDKQQGVDAVRVEGVADAISALRQEISRSVLGR